MLGCHANGCFPAKALLCEPWRTCLPSQWALPGLAPPTKRRGHAVGCASPLLYGRYPQSWRAHPLITAIPMAVETLRFGKKTCPGPEGATSSVTTCWPVPCRSGMGGKQMPAVQALHIQAGVALWAGVIDLVEHPARGSSLPWVYRADARPLMRNSGGGDALARAQLTACAPRGRVSLGLSWWADLVGQKVSRDHTPC